MLSPGFSQSIWVRYGMGFGFISTGLLVQIFLNTFEKGYYFILLYPLVCLTAWLAGLGPAVFAVLLAVAEVYWFSLGEGSRFIWPDSSMLFRFGTFTVFNVFIAWLIARSQNLIQILLQREKELQNLTQELQEALKTRDEFLAIASHELRTPLTTLKLQSQLFQRMELNGEEEKLKAAESIKKFIHTHSRQVDRLVRLVDDMLDISRMESGKFQLHIEKVNFTALVNEALERIKPQLQRAQCELEIDSTGPIEGEWDRFKVEQIIHNLVLNASQYASGKPIRVSVFQEGESVILKVKDQGAGIREEDHKRIFNRFERAISSSKISGLGLGLYIVQQIIELHRGSIQIQSKLNEGTTFIVRLPLHHETQSILTTDKSDLSPFDRFGIQHRV